jgi:guanyl-specific ribonuclease Sa
VTTATLRPIAMLGGDPGAIRESAHGWRRIGDRCTDWASSVRRCHVGGFIGDEAAVFEAHLEAFADRFGQAARAWHHGAAALSRFADRLENCQRELRWLECQLPSRCGGIGGDGEVAAGTDPGMLHRIYDRAAQVLTEHHDAVVRCRADLAAAAAQLPRMRTASAANVGSSPAIRASGGLEPLGWMSPAATRPAGAITTPAQARLAGAALRSIAAGLRTVSGTAGLLAAAPAVRSADDFFSEIGELLGVAGLALALFGAGGGGGLALAGGAGAAVAAPEVAVGAAAVAAGVGLGILIASAIKGESPDEVVDDALHPTVPGTPTADMHVIARMNRDSIPPDVLKEVDDAIARAKIGTERFPGHDGKIWRDEESQLPSEPAGYYREWTAAPNQAGRGWDYPDRVIIGGDPAHPDAIYYWDHTDNPPIYIGP